MYISIYIYIKTNIKTITPLSYTFPIHHVYIYIYMCVCFQNSHSQSQVLLLKIAIVLLNDTNYDALTFNEYVVSKFENDVIIKKMP